MVDREIERHNINMENIEASRGLVEILKAAYEAELLSKESYNKQLLAVMDNLKKFTTII